MRKSPSAQRGQARVKIPQRNQVEMQQLSLDEWLAADDRARIVWKYAESVDLSSLYDSLKAVQGGVGRDGIDPRILFSLWLLATLEGITSARTLAKLTIRDIAYMWICGGVSVNYHRLADFRVEHGDLLEQIMVDSIGVLLHHQLIQLETVAQDGMRVRANAGSSSFRRRGSLEKALENARMHVEQLKEASQADPAASNRRRQAAQERTAREQVERLEAARESLAKLEEQRKERSKRGDAPKSEPRASTTDADARCMKMGDGGWRPALNVQFASDGHARVIVGVDITNQGTDSGLMKPMCEQLKDIYDAAPEAYIVDGGYTKATDVTQLEQEGTAVYAPVYREQQQLAEGKTRTLTKLTILQKWERFANEWGPTRRRRH